MNFTSQVFASPEGGTVSLTGDLLPRHGYFVGGLVSPLIIEPTDSPAESVDALNEFIEYVNGPTVGADYLGWWTDEDTGKLWVDATTWHESEFQAGRVGRQRREIAIYDIERSRELRLVYVEGE